VRVIVGAPQRRRWAGRLARAPWQPLPADFVISALAAQRAGANRVLQYEICGVACA
jgi:hypothetical protein